MSTITKHLTEKFVWALIAEMDWASDNNYTRIKHWCLNNLDRPTCELIRSQVSEWMSNIDKMNPNADGVGDDGWSDVRAHIIGLGEDAYDKATNPLTSELDFVQDIIDRRAYTESFLYALPYNDDWSFDKDAIDRANQYLKELEEYEGSNILIRDIRMRLKLIVAGDWAGAVEDWDRDTYTAIGQATNYGPPNLVNDVANHVKYSS